jgi:hypothetical protein
MILISPARRLTPLFALALAVLALAVALLAPSSTQAQTHKPTCSSATHPKAKHAHACTQPARKPKPHHSKHHGKHQLAKQHRHGSSNSSADEEETGNSGEAECEEGDSCPAESSEQACEESSLCEAEDT